MQNDDGGLQNPKCCACHEKFNSSSEHLAKVLRLSHKTTVDTFLDTWQCHEVPRLPKTAYDIIWPRLKPFQHESTFPIDTATPQENQRIEMRHIGLEAPNVHFAQDFLKFSLLVAPKSTFSYTYKCSSWTPKFATPKSMFRARLPSIFIESHVTKCQSCHPICTLSPLDASLTVLFAQRRCTARPKSCACHEKLN